MTFAFSTKQQFGVLLCGKKTFSDCDKLDASNYHTLISIGSTYTSDWKCVEIM